MPIVEPTERSVKAGTRLGPYEILSRIGAGGMGEVWRARDTRLGRDVAIKILPDEFAADEKRKVRFEREAKIISHLQHPNICTLFDIGENYIVMELLEGESLADRLARGPLPVTEVVRDGVQIAEALGKAHRDGIIHRDLKPANIFLTKSGAKLLDFGLAKSTAEPSGGSETTTTLKASTEEGVVLGTFQYMAPEQLGGEKPDARSDIFSFGAVLYKMTTGKSAFEGKNRTSLIAAIVSGEPRPIRELQPLTPPALEHVVTKCLRKDPDDRWQNAADIAEELRWISEAGSQAGVASVVVSRRRWRERLVWIAALFAMAIAAAGLLLFGRRARVSEEPIEAAISMDATGGLAGYPTPPAFSPDGRALAFSASDKSGRMMLWVRSLSDSAARPLPNTQWAQWPFWSPDGKFIGFSAAGVLKKIPAGGGNVDVIAEIAIGSVIIGTWNHHGVILVGRGKEGLFRVAESGGDLSAVLKPDSIGATSCGLPWFLPDGNHFLFRARGDALKKRNQEGIWVSALDGIEKPRFVRPATSNFSYVAPGWLLFGRGGFVCAQRFDMKSLRATGEVASVAPVQFAEGIALYSASDSGTLVYMPPGNIFPTELRLKSRKGEVLRTYGRDYWAPRVSHDGRKIAVDYSPSWQGDIWIIGMQDGSKSRFSFEKVNESQPVWSPDDTAIAYYIGESEFEIRPLRDRMQVIVAKHLGGATEKLLSLPHVVLAATDWSLDGRFLLLDCVRSPLNSYDVAVLSLQTREVTDVAAGAAIQASAVFAPDGKWIAYQSSESGRREIYVQPFPVTGAKYQISTDGGRWPRWRWPDEITYVDETDHLTSVRVMTTNDFTADPPQTLPVTIDSHGGVRETQYDLTGDGNIVESAIVRDHPPPLTLLTNWYARLKK